MEADFTTRRFLARLPRFDDDDDVALVEKMIITDKDDDDIMPTLQAEAL